MQIRIKRTRDLFLDCQFSKEEYDEIILGLTSEKQNLETRLARLSKADEEFNKSMGAIFELASKSHELFKSSDGSEKRRIITILFPNLIMEGEKLVFTLRKPFDMMMNLSQCTNWLPKGSDIRTINGNFDEDFYSKIPSDAGTEERLKFIASRLNEEYTSSTNFFLREIQITKQSEVLYT